MLSREEEEGMDEEDEDVEEESCSQGHLNPPVVVLEALSDDDEDESFSQGHWNAETSKANANISKALTFILFLQRGSMLGKSMS